MLDFKLVISVIVGIGIGNLICSALVVFLLSCTPLLQFIAKKMMKITDKIQDDEWFGGV